MVEFKRNPKTGKLEIWKNGKKTGTMSTMGDEVKDGKQSKNHKQQR